MTVTEYFLYSAVNFSLIAQQKVGKKYSYENCTFMLHT